MVVEEIPPFCNLYVKCFEYPEKRYINELLLLLNGLYIVTDTYDNTYMFKS